MNAFINRTINSRTKKCAVFLNEQSLPGLPDDCIFGAKLLTMLFVFLLYLPVVFIVFLMTLMKIWLQKCSDLATLIITEICKCGYYPEIPDHMKNGNYVFNDDLMAFLDIDSQSAIALCVEYLLNILAIL